jgi:hypothetical protein
VPPWLNEALPRGDLRRRDAASTFVLRQSSCSDRALSRARRGRRGFSSTATAILVLRSGPEYKDSVLTGQSRASYALDGPSTRKKATSHASAPIKE